MSSDVSVAIGTFGDLKWVDIAQRAITSAENQSIKPDSVIHIHGNSLGEARNMAADQCDSKWIIFLDADDTLDSKYIENMLSPEDQSTVRQPSTLGVYSDGTEDDYPVLIPQRPLGQSNFLVIGSMCLKSQFMYIGGFDSTLPVLEDWDLFIRLHNMGAIIGQREKAIYRVGVNLNGRNKDVNLHGRYYNEIRRKYRP